MSPPSERLESCWNFCTQTGTLIHRPEIHLIPRRPISRVRPCKRDAYPGDDMDSSHRVAIVGGGFGGLYAAQALRKASVRVTLIDRRNFHLFQPLLYQVATGGLSPANIA